MCTAQHALRGGKTMVDRQCFSISHIEEPGSKQRWGSLANERSILDLLEDHHHQHHLQPTSLTLIPVNSNLYARRHSAHTCSITENGGSSSAAVSSYWPSSVPRRFVDDGQYNSRPRIPPPVPRRPPGVPKRTSNNIAPPTSVTNSTFNGRRSPTKSPPAPTPPIPPPPPPLPPPSLPTTTATPKRAKTRELPPIPTSSDKKPKPPSRGQFHNNDLTNTNSNNVVSRKTYDLNRNSASPKQSSKLPMMNSFDYNLMAQDFMKIPPAPIGPPPPAPKTSNQKPNVLPGTKVSSVNVSVNVNQQCNPEKVSIRQDSGISSDSFSQTSSPSYTTKSMETPLLPPRTPVKQHSGGLIAKIQGLDVSANSCSGAGTGTGGIGGADGDADADGNTTITKSASTPASLQTIVRFHNGSNMSLHHRIIRDMRRPSSHYSRQLRLRFRIAQIIINAIALLAMGAGMAAYFKAYPSSVQIVSTADNTTIPPVKERLTVNPAPGICLPVIVSFCQLHRVPYNFTVFPNYMGQFGQRDAQQELEVYDAVVDVRCYELAALFLCSVFVPKCGPGGVVVRPCRSLCLETKRRCGFFLDVFGLTLPSYLDCEFFPESTDQNKCIGHEEVKQAKVKAHRPVCPTGFHCDIKRCIPKDWQCDGHIDCKDQSDELNCRKCSSGMIHCGGDKCITQEHMCDGKVDCPWGQDERNCLRLSERNGDEGRGQLEVYRPDQQKWMPACVDHWDQKTSPTTICSLLGYSSTNGSRLLRGTDKHISPPIHDTTAIWRMNQNKRPKNIIREFGSCNGTSYPTVDLVCTNYMCGKARKTYSPRFTLREKRIVGGVRSKPGDWPFLAALLGGPEEIFYCAGVLIADQWVLTASHCVGNYTDVSGWTIQLGITRRHAHSFYGLKMKVKRVVPHPLYNLGVAHDNDVALLKLSSRVAFHEHLLPVCLPPANKELRPGTVCTVIGWGKKEDGGMSEYEPEVNEVEVPVLNRELCNAWLENRDLNVTDGMICAGYKEGGKDACQGDSGGPLLCRDSSDPDKWFVGGIVSWGIKCAHPHLPGVYAYVPKYIPWILQQMKLHSD